MSNNKKEEGMQDKFVNMGKWLSSLVNLYMPDNGDESKEVTIEKLSTYFTTEQNYLDVYFSAIPGLVSTEKPREVIMNLRGLKEKETRKEAIKTMTHKARITRTLLDTFLAIPEEELDQIVHKFSLYINLFTDMYIQK